MGSSILQCMHELFSSSDEWILRHEPEYMKCEWFPHAKFELHISEYVQMSECLHLDFP